MAEEEETRVGQLAGPRRSGVWAVAAGVEGEGVPAPRKAFCISSDFFNEWFCSVDSLRLVLFWLLKRFGVCSLQLCSPAELRDPSICDLRYLVGFQSRALGGSDYSWPISDALQRFSK